MSRTIDIDCKGSSWLRSLKYVPFDPETAQRMQLTHPTLDGFLIVEASGSRYAYAVPRSIVAVLRVATSKGSAVARQVRGKYPVVKIPEGMHV